MLYNKIIVYIVLFRSNQKANILSVMTQYLLRMGLENKKHNAIILHYNTKIDKYILCSKTNTFKNHSLI